MHFSRRIGLRGALGGLAGAIAALGAGYLALRQTGPASQALARSSLGRDFRFELWEDTRFAIVQYWPFGSGIGSFKPVFVAAERLEVVDPSMPVRAHNDFLELALEGGIFGLILLGLAAVWLGWMTLRAWRSSAPGAGRKGGSAGDSGARAQIIFAVAVFLIIALHSVVDYPLRSMALACLAGVAAGLLASVPSSRNDLELAGK
jgi:O-antigen ligase